MAKIIKGDITELEVDAIANAVKYLRKHCQQICESHNFRKVEIHKLRHTFATRSIEA
jgi:integrase